MEKILCIDNDIDILHLYHEEFSEDGYKVLMATNEKEALMKYQSELPQLVIIDIRMPGREGIKAMNAIVGKDREASIVINTFPQDPGNFLIAAGAKAYLVKSSDFRELKQKVREVLNNHSNPGLIGKNSGAVKNAAHVKQRMVMADQ